MTSNTVTAATGADAGASLAAHTIGLTINAPAQPLAFDTVLSVALRKNPPPCPPAGVPRARQAHTSAP
jgi:hypothetical protein